MSGLISRRNEESTSFRISINSEKGKPAALGGQNLGSSALFREGGPTNLYLTVSWGLHVLHMNPNTEWLPRY